MTSENRLNHQSKSAIHREVSYSSCFYRAKINDHQSVHIWHKHLSNIPDECEIGAGTSIHSNVWIGEGAIIGQNVSIQAFVYIPKGVTIKDNVFLGPRVTFTNDKYPPSTDWSDTVVEEGASIGASVTIVAGVTVGKGALIGAGSVVTKNIPPNEIWLGNPAKFHKKRAL